MSGDEYFHEDMIMELSEEEHASTQRLLKSNTSHSKSSLHQSPLNHRTFGGALQSPSNYDSNSDGERGSIAPQHESRRSELPSSPAGKSVMQLKQQIHRENERNKNLLAKVVNLERDLAADEDVNVSVSSKHTRSKAFYDNKGKEISVKKIAEPPSSDKRHQKSREVKQSLDEDRTFFDRNPSFGKKTPLRYGQMSEEEAAHAFESRKKELYSELLLSVKNKKRGNSPGLSSIADKISPRTGGGTPQQKPEKSFVIYSHRPESHTAKTKMSNELERTPSTRKTCLLYTSPSPRDS
eukprot:TRINITY_DN14423_c0_g1_i2.p1 TRINITY_DN14423_c0_g1~~TRINITY_DN14423_c0_g1_i2.p1  ORF type:complete len:295 (+),score=40.18 TRINITY_DN14423_c0_g1_i2:86-970(+)